MEPRRARRAGRPGLALGEVLLCSADRHPYGRPHRHPVWLGRMEVTRPLGPPIPPACFHRELSEACPQAEGQRCGPSARAHGRDEV